MIFYDLSGSAAIPPEELARACFERPTGFVDLVASPLFVASWWTRSLCDSGSVLAMLPCRGGVLGRRGVGVRPNWLVMMGVHCRLRRRCPMTRMAAVVGIVGPCLARSCLCRWARVPSLSIIMRTRTFTGLPGRYKDVRTCLAAVTTRVMVSWCLALAFLIKSRMAPRFPISVGPSQSTRGCSPGFSRGREPPDRFHIYISKMCRLGWAKIVFKDIPMRQGFPGLS